MDHTKPTPILWAAIRETRGDEAALTRWCEALERDQLILLHRRAAIAAAVLVEDPSFREHVKGDRVAQLAVAHWVVTQGEAAWTDARRSAAGLSRRVSKGGLPAVEVMARVFRERFGEGIPEQEPDPAERTDLTLTDEWLEAVWDLVEVMDVGVPVDHAVVRYTRAELVLLVTAIEELAERLLTPELRDELEERLDDDLYERLMCTVGAGREVYEQVRECPDRAAELMPTEGRNLFEIVSEVYERRYDTVVPAFPGRRLV